VPNVRVVYVTIKPSPQKWAFWDVIQKANGAIKALCEADPALSAVDISAVLIDEHGKLRTELYLPDGHFTPAGYARILALIKPAVEKAWAAAGGKADVSLKPTPGRRGLQ
jgi:lysophospholipase L1-like esterase